MSARLAWIWPSLLAILLYAPSLGSGFIYDDESLLVENTRIALASPRLAFTSDFWGMPDTPQAWRGTHYRPLGMLAYSAVYRVFGLSPFAFHGTNILLHATATAAFYALLAGLGFSGAVCFVSALLFAVHPLHVESVVWMSGMSETQAAAAILGSLACFVHGKRAWSFVLAAIAMLTKESGLIVPVLILVLAYLSCSTIGSRLERIRDALQAAFPSALLAAAYLAARSLILRHPPPGAVRTIFMIRWPAIPLTALSYLKLLFWPWPLAINYEMADVATRLFGLGLIVAWLIAMLYWRSFRDELAVAGVLIAAPLAIPVLTSPLMAPELQVQDRYAYTAVAGACLIVALLLDRVSRKTLIYACLFLAPLGALGTYLQLQVWDSNETMWTHTLEVTPSSKQAALNLAYQMYVEQRFGEAIKVYRRALRYHPGDKDLLQSLNDMQKGHAIRQFHPRQ